MKLNIFAYPTIVGMKLQTFPHKIKSRKEILKVKLITRKALSKRHTYARLIGSNQIILAAFIGSEQCDMRRHTSHNYSRRTTKKTVYDWLGDQWH